MLKINCSIVIDTGLLQMLQTVKVGGGVAKFMFEYDVHDTNYLTMFFKNY